MRRVLIRATIAVTAMILSVPGAWAESGGLWIDEGPAETDSQYYRDCQGTAERPYVCDVGMPRPVSWRSFREIFSADSALQTVIARIGMPDWAEMQMVDVGDPWMNWELRTYYRDYNKMLVFARALMLGNPDVSMLRYEGPIPAGKVVGPYGVMNTNTSSSAYSAVTRAERAAAEAEAAAARAQGAASKMAQEFPAQLRKK